MRSHLALAIVFAFLFAACRGAEYSIGPQFGPLTIDGGMTWTDAAGPFAVAANPGENQVEDFGIEDDESLSGGLRFDSRAKVYHYMLSLQGASWSGTGTLAHDFDQIESGATVDTDVALFVLRNYFTFDVVPAEAVEIGIGIALDAAVVGATVDEQGPNLNSVEEDVDLLTVVGAPLLAARVALHLGPIDVECFGGLTDLTVFDTDVQMLELDANAKLRFAGKRGGPSGFVVAGLRRNDFELDYDDDEDEVSVDLDFRGPYFGVQFGW